MNEDKDNSGADDPVWSRDLHREEGEAKKEATVAVADDVEAEQQARPPTVLRPFVSGVESDTQLERMHLTDEETSSPPRPF